MLLRQIFLLVYLKMEMDKGQPKVVLRSAIFTLTLNRGLNYSVVVIVWCRLC